MTDTAAPTRTRDRTRSTQPERSRTEDRSPSPPIDSLARLAAAIDDALEPALPARTRTSASVTVYGAGYVGLVTAACLAADGHHVTVLEVDRAKLRALAEGRMPIHEPGLDAVITHETATGRLRFAHPDDDHSLARARALAPERPSTATRPRGDAGRAADSASPSTPRFVFVAVGTPSTAAGSADLSAVRDVIDRLDSAATPPNTIVVMKSTVPPGTGAPIARRLKHGPARAGYVANPEFLREGSALADWYHTDRVVLGGDPEHTRAVARLYDGLDAPIVTCDVTSAELVKYASNAFLATKISFINEIAHLCDTTGADIADVAYAVGLDRRIGHAFMRAGIGYGGSCFPKDTRALDFVSTVNGHDFQLLKGVIEVNARQRMLPVIALRNRFGSLEGRRVAVLGLTFKPDTDDVRESPAEEIAILLMADGAEVRGYDPIGELDMAHQRYVPCLEIAEALAGADAAIVATEWPQIASADWASLAPTMTPGALVFDGRNCLDASAVSAAGLEYRGVGRR